MTLAEYPPATDCGRCGHVYGRHRELECPEGGGTFSPVIAVSPNGRHEAELANLRSQLDAMTLSRDNYRTDEGAGLFEADADWIGGTPHPHQRQSGRSAAFLLVDGRH